MEALRICAGAEGGDTAGTGKSGGTAKSRAENGAGSTRRKGRTCTGGSHLEPTPRPKDVDHFDELEQMLEKKHLPEMPKKQAATPAPQKSRFQQILKFFKFRR